MDVLSDPAFEDIVSDDQGYIDVVHPAHIDTLMAKEVSPDSVTATVEIRLKEEHLIFITHNQMLADITVNLKHSL